MRVALYLRVSTDDQHVANQRPALEAVCAQRGWSIVDVYEDVDVSGTKLKRPALERLLADAARARFDVVYVWALDRFARDGTFSGGLRLMGELEEQYRVALVSYEDRHLDGTGPFRGVLVTLGLKMAEEERKRILARANAGRERTKAEIATRGYAVSRKSGKVIKSLGRPGVTIPEAHALAALELRRGGLSWERVARELARRYSAPLYHKASLRRAAEARRPSTAENENVQSGADSGPPNAA